MMTPPTLPLAAATGGIEAVFAAQKATALKLRLSTAAERIAKLKRLEQAVQANRARIYAALRADLHKPEAEADLTEILPVISEIKHAVRHLRSWMRTRSRWPTLSMLGTSAQVRYEPKGTCLIISPWNYPLNLALGPLVSALAAGNTAILKPSELTPATSALIAEIVTAAFAPEEVAVFEGGAEISTALLELPFDHIFFTGSPAVGKIVMAAAARNLASVTLELGGKSPVIVDASANLDQAAASIAWGKFANNGQTCIAPDYLYVQDTVAPGLAARLREQIAKMYGPDAQMSLDYCRIVNDRHFARVQNLIEDAVARGGRLVAGGDNVPAKKYFAPTLIADAPLDSRIMQEEVFGPVLPIVTFKDVAEPIAHINAQPKPLALYIFSKQRAQISRILRETSSGGAGINLTLLHFLHNNLPFGGVNNSGLGNSHGHAGFKAFSHERAVLKNFASVTPLLFPPYTKRVMFLVKTVLKYFA
jgi:aldehyde dehydrogenase (NAD+)